jgi:serine protease inhibitor
MIHKVLSNIIHDTEYEIAKMYENIRFDMDEKGARVENEAVVVLRETMAAPSKMKYKSMIVDKPYWVVMKRYDSDNPYFILGVKNTEMMKKG